MIPMCVHAYASICQIGTCTCSVVGLPVTGSSSTLLQHAQYRQHLAGGGRLPVDQQLLQLCLGLGGADRPMAAVVAEIGPGLVM